MTTPAEDALFTRLKSTADPDARDELAERFLPMARALATRYRSSSESMDDLFQVASLGLVKAIDRFDPGRGSSFESFAAPTILGELKRHFRDRVLPVHIPRGVKERGQRIGSSIEDLTSQLDRSPTIAEIASHSGITVDETIEALGAIEASRTVSLDMPMRSDDGDAPAAIEGLGERDPDLESVESKLAVDDAMSVLETRERTCVKLRFSGGLTQREIGAEVGVSQVHVSRILRIALDKMRAAVDDEEADVAV